MSTTDNHSTDPERVTIDHDDAKTLLSFARSERVRTEDATYEAALLDQTIRSVERDIQAQSGP